MTMRRVYWAGICALSLCLTACDSGVAFPGFDEKPGTPTEVPPPPPSTPPVQPIDSVPDGDQTPAPETPTPPSEPLDTPQLPDEAETPEVPSPESETERPEAPSTSDTAPTEPAPSEAPVGASDETPEDIPASDVPTAPEEPTETPTETAPEPSALETEAPDETPAPEPVPAVAPAFSYHAPGSLAPDSGRGSLDETVYAPEMVFPIKDAPAFPQSMVFQPGGFRYAGDLPGDECIPENYQYPWRDNFCERGRPSSFKSASCPAGKGIHLGQDIRVGDGPTCQSMRARYRTDTQSITDYKVVAAEDGMISNISSYTVTLRAGPRTYRYLHMNMRALQVSIGDTVKADDLLGYVSKDFGFDSNGRRRPTTFHLHFVLKINTDQGSVFVPPYTSLVDSYARREGAPGERIERNVAIASDTLNYDPNEVFEFIE